MGAGLALAAARVFGFLKGVPWQVYAALAAAILGLVLWHAHGNAVKHAYDAAYSEGASAAAAKFNAAQKAADNAARAHVAATVTKQDTVSKESSHALDKANSDIDARARDISVRHAAAVARERNSQPGDMPVSSGAPGQSCPAPASDGLSWSTAYPLMVQAQKNEAQLNAILDWEAKQATVAADAQSDVEAPAP